ncbi:MAG: restriction endonuclease [Candidatus Anammoxibacter sp.]
MTNNLAKAKQYVEAIKKSKLTIYDPIEIGDPELWIPTKELEIILNSGLRGISVKGLPIRTRSKVVKEHVCSALGYPIPSSFKKTQPRFPGQFFDTYNQKANNLQVWNEELSSTRRYVIIRISEDDEIIQVKVVTGDTLTTLDTTGTLTQKYQARLNIGNMSVELISKEDTKLLRGFTSSSIKLNASDSPIQQPVMGQLLAIDTIFNRLSKLVGKSFPDRGHDQERNRGAELHKLICKYLGYSNFRDDGQFPDVRHQLLEVKLQTSPTIDLGLVCPNSTEPLDVPKIQDQQIRHCDVRYALFYAKSDGQNVTLTHFFLTTGESFFSRFPQFQGKVLNKKLQIPLPSTFFEG